MTENLERRRVQRERDWFFPSPMKVSDNQKLLNLFRNVLKDLGTMGVATAFMEQTLLSMAIYLRSKHT